MTQTYELVFLTQKEEDTKAIEKIINDNSGKLLEQNSWGEKTLAYRIKNYRTARYFCWKFAMNRSHLAELRKKLDFNDQIIRYLILSKD